MRSFFLGTKIKHDDQKIYSRKFIFQRRDAKFLFEHGKHENFLSRIRELEIFELMRKREKVLLA